MPTSVAPLPLASYRVLDLTEEHGALCSRLLGDMGADVVKIERPEGDPSRRIGPFFHDDPHPERSLSWWAFNANKRSATLRLNTADGQALLRDLIATSDFLVESFSIGYLDDLGLGYADIERINPSIIVTSITPHGPDGPHAGYAATDITLMAAGGLMHLAGNEERAPLRFSAPQADAQAGVQAAMGTLIAHQHRRRTGQGQHVELSMQAAIVNTLIEVQSEWDINQDIRGRGLRTGWGPLTTRTLYKCSDGYVTWKWFVDRGRGRRNAGLIRWMVEEGADEGLAEWDFEAMTLYSMTQEQVDQVEEIAQRFFARKTRADIYRHALDYRFLTFPVNTPKDIFEDEQMKARAFFTPVDHPELGESVQYPGSFVSSSQADYGVRLRPPLIGEHNEAIYVDTLGLARDELATLKQAGII